MFEYFSCIRLPAFSRVDQNTVQTVHARFSALDGSQSHMIGTISLHPVVHITKSIKAQQRHLYAPIQMRCTVHRVDNGLELEQHASLNFAMMMAGMRAVSSYANT